MNEFKIDTTEGALATVLAIFIDDPTSRYQNLEIAKEILGQIKPGPVWLQEEHAPQIWIVSKTDPDKLWFNECFLLVSIRNGEAFASGEVNLKQDDNADDYCSARWTKIDEFETNL